MSNLDFFFFFGSAYSYLSVLRIGKLAKTAGVTICWRPFNVRPLMQENNVALRREERKVKYMWRDVERRAAIHGLPFSQAPVWPTDPDLLHNRVGLVAAEQGWIEPFAVSSFKGWFLEGKELGEKGFLTRLISERGHNPEVVFQSALSDRIAERYEAQTEAARQNGIFGAPSFVADDGELFWGDDRLEEAIRWAAKHKTQ